MSRDLKSILKKIAEYSRTILCEYISKLPSNKVPNFRFFSYGSNMNEGKFREDTRSSGYEFGLVNARKRVLKGYKRILGNKSENHGLVFTICPSEKDQVEGICHNVPIEGLESFLRKEGVLLKQPTYELILVSISNKQHPVLTLKGLKPFELEKLHCKDKLKAFCYVSTSIRGAERWEADCSDMSKIKSNLEKELCENHDLSN